MPVIRAYITGKSIVIFNPEWSRKIYSMGYYGQTTLIPKPKSLDFSSPLELSPYDTLYLLEKKVIEVVSSGKMLSFDEAKRIFSGWIENFDVKWFVYRDLRNKGFVVRSGLKFGGTFVVYKHGPGIDHAPFIVDVMSKNISPIEIVRAGRLATSVRKAFVIANVQNNRVEYFVFKWFGK